MLEIVFLVGFDSFVRAVEVVGFIFKKNISAQLLGDEAWNSLGVTSAWRLVGGNAGNATRHHNIRYR